MLRLSQKYPSKRAFITGAAGGLGLAFALELAQDGWKIAMADLNFEKLKEAAAKVIAAGAEVEIYSFDVTDHSQFKLAIEDFEQKVGAIDFAINSAGLGCGGYIDELPIEIFRKIIDVNLMGTINGCHLFVPSMKRQRSGHILNIASAAAFVSAPMMSPYNISKAGVVSLSESLRSELVDSNVFTTVLMPAYIRTDLGKGTLGPELYSDRAQYLMEHSALEPADVARIALKAVAAEKLYVVLPRHARFLWRLKRLLPNRFWTIVKFGAERLIAKVDKAPKS
ncbi:MAG: SDR family NAD(P)-dependent oxidoreductase [Candidatus Obscuribacterales bacterium]